MQHRLTHMGYDEIMKLGLERGFFLPSCEIYPDAPAGFWEYGPLGTALKNRFAELWRREIVRRDGMVEMDGCTVMSKSVFKASGHLESFFDPFSECARCGAILRTDKFICEKIGQIVPEGLEEEHYDAMLQRYSLTCPRCGGSFKPTRKFNMMFRVGIGPTGEDAYLRPETCQSIFMDFPRLFRALRLKLPVGFAQFGKSFRNELSPRQGFIRLRELYQAEVEVFFNPKTSALFNKFNLVQDLELRILQDRDERLPCKLAVERGIIPNRLVGYYLAILSKFYEKTGLNMERCRFRVLSDKERAFYAQASFDFEVETSLGWLELVACNYRGEYDLKSHSAVSKKDLTIFDGGEQVLPHIFELSMGVDRSIYALLEHSLVKEGDRDLLTLKPYLAPLQVGVLPLVSKDGLPERAGTLFENLRLDFDASYDESGSIGRRYRRLDEVGTPFCITIDYETLKDDTVTLRDRDTMQQTRYAAREIKRVIQERLSMPSATRGL